jgi:hypothetical protein
MSSDSILGVISPPYVGDVNVWSGEGRAYKQHDLVPSVGMSQTYSIWLDTTEDAPPRFVTVMDNRITSPMAHQPAYQASVYDRWGNYLGQGGDPLERPKKRRGAEGGVPLTELVREAPVAEEPPTVLETEEEPPTVPEDASAPEMRRHRFWLREDLEIVVELPLDFTDEEAERVAVFVTTLPMSRGETS